MGAMHPVLPPNKNVCISFFNGNFHYEDMCISRVLHTFSWYGSALPSMPECGLPGHESPPPLSECVPMRFATPLPRLALVTHLYSAHAALHDKRYQSFLPCPLGTTSVAFSCH